MEDVKLLLSFIETEVINGKKTFMGNGVVVNGDGILSLIKRIRFALNESDGTNLCLEAQERAQEIVNSAEIRKEQILDESTVIKEAKAIADKTVRDAFAYKQEIEDRTQRNVAAMLNSVRKSLVDLTAGIDKAVEELNDISGGN